ncbi:serine/threonine-protein kinase [Colwellia psychrerythraea]|uniref:Serine/threonine protein kinase domain protein n=1 Tax=Colwellia psychrerythraea (strain 34H / ATCC BAA-681) TaxID=167879 RepID=Q487L7_COLP3|nr:serine/threonine-protein kinase [Colwellia psychrerythraea]AAZ27069.1 serine/threonine protein kinase domain protein [Colwellia psychrerythraea 34H]
MDNKLPHYSRERLLGEGGMGKVYLAQDNQLQRQVAIKELTYQPKDDEVNHALKEARLLARVNHSNIIQIYNVHDEGDHISLVMEYFNSKTLTQFQQEAYTTLVQKLDLLQQLSAGLAAAHKNGVIHCDLKPSNILVNDQGQLKITDFGIALLASNESQNSEQTASNNPLQFGSLLFMSPEQIKLQAVDYRSDIFSFGIIAYQLMVGSHPFAYGNNGGSATDVAKRICEHTPEHAKNLMLNAPSALTDLLMEMLVKPLEQRTLTAEAIENRLKHIRTALLQAEISEQATMPLSSGSANIAGDDTGQYTQAVHTTLLSQNTQIVQPADNLQASWFKQNYKTVASIALLCLVMILFVGFYNTQEVETKQVVILKPTLADSSLMAPMQQDLVISAVEDALRQAVINTKNMYLISQREVNAITKEYPDDLNKLRQAVGASDIISTTLECDNSRCKVSFSRLVVNDNSSDNLSVKSEKNWLAPVDKFNAIFSTSQTQFASLFPEESEVNQSGLVQRPINENDYRNYIELYSQIKGQGEYSVESLTKLETLLTRSPYLYAAYGLFRETASNLYTDSRDEIHLKRLELVLQNSPPEYRYSVYHAIDSFFVAYKIKELDTAQQQIIEAKNKGASSFVLSELNAILFFSKGQYQKAADTFEEALVLRPSTTLLYNLAFSYWRMGDLSKAEDALNKMLEIIPGNYKAQQLQANIWLLQGKLELAITAYEKIVAALSNGRDLTNLSLAYALNKQYKKSLIYAKKAVDLSPKNRIRRLNLADIEFILGRVKSSNFNYKKVIDAPVDNNKYRYWLDIAQAQLQLNQQNLAIEALNKAKHLAPDNGEVAYTSALVYSVLGERVSAIFEVNKALANKVGSVWFNLPWFDSLCDDKEFELLMVKYNNQKRCRT